MLKNELTDKAAPLFLTDGGLETTLIYKNGIELPEFAAFPLLATADGRDSLRCYYKHYIDIARHAGTGFILETPTWRASQKWATSLGYGEAELREFNSAAVEMMQDMRERYATEETPMLISGCIGPQDDGYQPQDLLSIEQAESYHMAQMQAFKQTGVDMVTATTMTYPDEAIGIANAGARVGLPVVVSFTVETDGRLPVAVTLADAIERTDRESRVAPAYYMINCAHPDHFRLSAGDPWLRRISGVRANASRMSHAELDECDALDDGNPTEFGELHRALQNLLPNLKAIGGCCGTDHRHIAAVAHECA